MTGATIHVLAWHRERDIDDACGVFPAACPAVFEQAVDYHLITDLGMDALVALDVWDVRPSHYVSADSLAELPVWAGGMVSP